jgi:hypothetical protein
MSLHVADLRVLLKNDELLQGGCGRTLQRYQEEQFMTVVLESSQHTKAMVCRHALLGSAGPGQSRYLDPNGGIEFTFSHVNGVGFHFSCHI